MSTIGMVNKTMGYKVNAVRRSDKKYSVIFTQTCIRSLKKRFKRDSAVSRLSEIPLNDLFLVRRLIGR